jgi:hypothetical protein
LTTEFSSFGNGQGYLRWNIFLTIYFFLSNANKHLVGNFADWVTGLYRVPEPVETFGLRGSNGVLQLCMIGILFTIYASVGQLVRAISGEAQLIPVKRRTKNT